MARGRAPEVVWVNELGGTTFRIGPHYVKWSPAGAGLPPLAGEVARLSWAAPFTPVPEVVEHGRDAAGEWMVTAALPGGNAVEPRWKADPRTAVTALGRGLRALHDALPVDRCPFTWSAADRVASAHRRSAELDPARWHASHRDIDVAAALAAVAEPPPVDRAVVCHGDACAPNTLLTDDGAWSGHVDLGALGVADRWADLAVATWSTQWNYGDGWERTLLDAYGVEPDPRRTAYYRLLWDLGP
ncbi:aminoglycoside 3'-phosphotransferase [Pseudonocardia sp. S2-4]|uniref:Aminoglycoside 3'-phosphotransferase n=2 Tax=Pseudonocardia humida TaxID=2800819 RepID=A0ABT0ZYC9_9PSEU|nr:aminoglycoside 3'-phosphotransferase [Pseudonocardia humida]